MVRRMAVKMMFAYLSFNMYQLYSLRRGEVVQCEPS